MVLVSSTSCLRYFIMTFMLAGHMEGIPLNKRLDHVWKSKTGTKVEFSQYLLQRMGKLFFHHQIDVAQRDGHRILLSQVEHFQYWSCFSL